MKRSPNELLLWDVLLDFCIYFILSRTYLWGNDVTAVLTTEDLCGGNEVLFAATVRAAASGEQ